jgi:SAM-dependent methyltransferase
VGHVIGINGYRVNRAALKQRFAEGGYQAHEAPHFLLLTRSEPPTIVIVHWFAPEAIDADLGDYVIQELKPLGILAQPQDFSDVFGAMVGSLFPYNVQRAWLVYGTNTLRRYQDLLMNPPGSPVTHSTINTFARLYRRVSELLVGDHFLDAGCSFGFLPLLVAQQFPALSRVVGIDIRPEPFTTTRLIAQERGLRNVQFVQADLLTGDLSTLGYFDTVTALHVFEHFCEEAMYRVLRNLLRVTARRLVLAVPYEQGEPEILYGHEQLFSRSKLEAIGQYCLQQWNGESRMWCEECEGGLLVVERRIPQEMSHDGQSREQGGHSPQKKCSWLVLLNGKDFLSSLEKGTCYAESEMLDGTRTNGSAEPQAIAETGPNDVD